MHPPLKTFMDWLQIFRSLLRRAIFFFISQEIVFEEEMVKKSTSESTVWNDYVLW